MCEGCHCGVGLYVLDAPSYVAGVGTVCSVQHAPQECVQLPDSRTSQAECS